MFHGKECPSCLSSRWVWRDRTAQKPAGVLVRMQMAGICLLLQNSAVYMGRSCYSKANKKQSFIPLINHRLFWLFFLTKNKHVPEMKLRRRGNAVYKLVRYLLQWPPKISPVTEKCFSATCIAAVSPAVLSMGRDFPLGHGGMTPHVVCGPARGMRRDIPLCAKSTRAKNFPGRWLHEMAEQCESLQKVKTSWGRSHLSLNADTEVWGWAWKGKGSEKSCWTCHSAPITRVRSEVLSVPCSARICATLYFWSFVTGHIFFSLAPKILQVALNVFAYVQVQAVLNCINTKQPPSAFALVEKGWNEASSGPSYQSFVSHRCPVF